MPCALSIGNQLATEKVKHIAIRDAETDAYIKNFGNQGLLPESSYVLLQEEFVRVNAYGDRDDGELQDTGFTNITRVYSTGLFAGWICHAE
ncbi:hypothetical protein [Paenibacillus sp. Root444D2]|uniref:hypothetical protein n=1 Tax=Paenibacillus sp. Root444D2 TaxID=1736538 RepID=UPI00071010AF|nr:hypothetical protein [Paenibacillus sp. Root444D2]KQX68178.1 hypothetical protein ASD40_25195 [Paenibacillus sp. Root444D2]